MLPVSATMSPFLATLSLVWTGLSVAQLTRQTSRSALPDDPTREAEVAAELRDQRRVRIQRLWLGATALASPAMGHWGTCPPSTYKKIIFFQCTKPDSDYMLTVISCEHPVTCVALLAPNPGDAIGGRGRDGKTRSRRWGVGQPAPLPTS